MVYAAYMQCVCKDFEYVSTHSQGLTMTVQTWDASEQTNTIQRKEHNIYLQCYTSGAL